jgi:hypothetical protein
MLELTLELPAGPDGLENWIGSPFPPARARTEKHPTAKMMIKVARLCKLEDPGLIRKSGWYLKSNFPSKRILVYLRPPAGVARSFSRK